MAQIIVSSRYLKSGKRGKTKRRNYTKYIATRESVEKRPQNTGKTTANQKQLIAELIKEFPMAKQYLEYTDYTKNPSSENASELISTIIECHADVIGNRRNFVGYMANRPGAERRGEHGLFNGSDEPIDLNAVANEVAEHPGYVWTHVVSLRREDTVRLGYTNSDMWRELVKRHIDDISKAQNIPIANMKWYAAFHDTTHHPHIHLIVYSTNPRQGYLTKEGMAAIRSAFANDIFHEDLKSIYQAQTLTRDELKSLSENNMKEIVARLGSGEIDERIVISIQKLYEQLQFTKGKKVYGYLPKDVKQTVDDIFLLISHDKNIQELYDKWCEFESVKYRIYTQKEKEFPALTENKEFQSVRNMIIRTVMKIGNTPAESVIPEIPENDNDDDTLPVEDYGDQIEPEDAAESDIVPTSGYMNNHNCTLKWSRNYKAARKLLYDKSSGIKEYQEAEKMLLSEQDNALAIYELGKLYSSDKLGGKDDDRADEFYTEALRAFIEIEPSAGNMVPFDSKFKNAKPLDMRPYVWYRIGKMYCYGIGSEQNYTEAFRWLERSAAAGNKYAQFSIGSLYYYGNGVEKSYEKAFECYLKSANKGHPYAAYSVAQMYSKGEGVDTSHDKAFNYYRRALSGFLKLESDDQTDEMLLYKLGRMYREGLGTAVDTSKAMQYLLRAAQHGEKNAQRMIAQEYISGVNMHQDKEKGVAMLTDLVKSDDKLAAYKLGKLYFSCDIIYKDYDKAEKYLRLASDDNEYAMYALARLYMSDERKNLSEAVRLLEKACDYKNIKPYAAYTSAKILLDDNEFHDSEKAIQLLKETADTNIWCSYLLGKLYLFGNNGIEKDKAEAVKWLTLSAKSGNQYAQELLNYSDGNNSEVLADTVVSLLINLGRIIEDDNRRSRKNISRADRKLMQAILRKKQELGIKSDGIEMQYDY